ncbi:hypothetical protein [Erwinia sp. JH02]|uniref:hypothetical protein n=1 Tax=Erwinia sp. JH02 TaxID=2733394 RepID=UPI001489F658|nr:hypothetical protein [Erwinia sp. JH02]NNS06217.1 hypothetical protein [Erwinia sp. JH02]
MSNYDFETVKDSLYKFFSDKNTKVKLAHILDKGTNDWEKWFQIEYEFFLENSLDYKAKRELRAIADRRHQTGRSHMFVDLIFRKKGSRLDRFIYLEFKLGKKPTTLVNNMKEDLFKNYEIVESHYKKTGLKRRSVWSIGFYRNFSTLTINRAEDELKYIRSKHFSVLHDTLYICKCRGKNHTDECHKLGLVIIGSGT